MNFKRLYLLLVLFPLVLACTKGDDPGSSVPPPPTPVTPDPGGDPGETHPWDANRGKVVRPQNLPCQLTVSLIMPSRERMRSLRLNSAFL